MLKGYKLRSYLSKKGLHQLADFLSDKDLNISDLQWIAVVLCTLEHKQLSAKQIFFKVEILLMEVENNELY